MDLSAAAFSFVSVNRPEIKKSQKKKNAFAQKMNFVNEELNPFSQNSLDNVVFREPSHTEFGNGPGGFNTLG